MPTVDANGLALHYHTEGAGPPLVMLHGATSPGKEDSLARLPAFKRAFRLYVPDARGHAETKWDARRGFSTEMLVADLAAFADALGLPTFHLLGFSMGAMTALQFAVRHPGRLRTLVLVGCDTQREPRTAVPRRLLVPARIDREAPACRRGTSLPIEQRTMTTPGGVEESGSRGGGRSDVGDAAGPVPAP